MSRFISLIVLIILATYTQAQNVGLGQTAPKSKLDVNGGATIGSSYSGTNAAPTNGAIIQGQVGIGTSSPNAAAALDITSTTQGVLYPRMTLLQRNAIPAPVAGLVIYNSDCDNLNYYSSTYGWKPMYASGPAAQAATNLTATSFSANWNAPSNATGYYLDVSTSASFTSFVTGYNALSVGNVTTYSVTGLTCGTAYYYRVRAILCAGVSDNSNVVTVTARTTGTQVFSYTGSSQTFNVPCGVTSLSVKLWGAGGAGGEEGSGGSGAYMQGTLAVTPLSSVIVIVGQGGGITGTTAYGGGGSGYYSGGLEYSGSGGGRSALQLTAGTDIVTAGGGGGGGNADNTSNPYGGAGGGPNGTAGGNSGTGGGGGGGTTATFGAGGTGSTGTTYNGTAGSSLTGGAGNTGNAGNYYPGGGGGGGYYGGGGGAGGKAIGYSGGGGGGSSYPAASTASFTLITNTVGNTASTTSPLPPDIGDANYTSGVGAGGSYTPTAGGSGEVVISW